MTFALDPAVAETPVFSSLGVGLADYQPAGSGFTVWCDDLAYDAERIGQELCPHVLVLP